MYGVIGICAWLCVEDWQRHQNNNALARRQRVATMLHCSFWLFNMQPSNSEHHTFLLKLAVFLSNIPVGVDATNVVIHKFLFSLKLCITLRCPPLDFSIVSVYFGKSFTIHDSFHACSQKYCCEEFLKLYVHNLLFVYLIKYFFLFVI